MYVSLCLLCRQLDDILDASLVGDDELVMAGMDESDATKFHAARFQHFKRKREEKLKEDIEEKHRKQLEDLSPTSLSNQPFNSMSNALVEVDEQEEGEEYESERGEYGGHYEQEEGQYEAGEGGVDRVDEAQEYYEHSFNEEDERVETALEDVDMLTFLGQIFLPSEASTYAAILSSLGVESPKELAQVTQDMLVAAGIKKFHARKIGSAEIYRAFL